MTSFCSLFGCCGMRDPVENSNAIEEASKEAQLSFTDISTELSTDADPQSLLNMSHKQKLWVKKTAHFVFEKVNIEFLSVKFLHRFFSTYPNHKNFFKIFRNHPTDELLTLPVLQNHGRKVMVNMRKMVNLMDRVDLLTEHIGWLYSRHCIRNVQSFQMQDMLYLFVDFIESMMGPELFKEKHRKAWIKWTEFLVIVFDTEEKRQFNSLRRLQTIREEGTVVDVTSGAEGSETRTVSSPFTPVY